MSSISLYERKQCVTKAINVTNLSWLTSHFTVAINDVCNSVAAKFLSVWSWMVNNSLKSGALIQ